MLVSALRYTRKFNLGNYESEDIAIEAVPDDGQSAEELLTECRDFVLGSRGLPKGAPVGNGKPASPPPTPANGAVQTAPEPSTNGHAKKKRGKGRPPKAFTEAKKAVDAAKDAANMEDFLAAFNDARTKASAFTLDEWEEICTGLKDTYRRVNDPESDPEIVAAVVNAFKAERTNIDTRRNGR